MKISFAPLLILILASCAHHPSLTNKAKGVVLMKPEDGKCKKIDDVSVFLFFGRKNSLNLENHFKNEVAELGGNAGYPVKVNTFQPSLEGIAYKCPEDYVQLHKKDLYK